MSSASRTSTTTSTSTPIPDLAFLLNQAGHALNIELAGALAELGISPRIYCVLSKAIGADLTQNRLAELSALDKTTMVVTLDEMERAGLAERRPSSTDRRARVIAVTPAGERTLHKAERIVNGVYAGVLDALPASEREPFVSALQRLVDDRLSSPLHTEVPVRRRPQRSAALVR